MIWPLSRKSKKRMARICIEGPINAETRKNVLKALKQIEERESSQPYYFALTAQEEQLVIAKKSIVLS